jgi:PPM family protein phosphatase
MQFSSHGHSDVGFVRENNEDSFVIDNEKAIFAVADGVGGLPFGNLASRLAVKFYDSLISSSSCCKSLDEINVIIHKIHRNIIECGELVGGENGIGTTFSGIRVVDGNIMFAHVGDSSIFLLDGDGFRKVSKSHTLRDELLEKHGENAALDMPEHYGHTLTRCMGQDIDFEVDRGQFQVSAGAIVLICSDGVTNMIEETVLEETIRTRKPADAVSYLIDLANQNGGIDNSTAVCVKFG